MGATSQYHVNGLYRLKKKCIEHGLNKYSNFELIIVNLANIRRIGSFSLKHCWIWACVFVFSISGAYFQRAHKICVFVCVFHFGLFLVHRKWKKKIIRKICSSIMLMVLHFPALTCIQLLKILCSFIINYFAHLFLFSLQLVSLYLYSIKTVVPFPCFLSFFPYIFHVINITTRKWNFLIKIFFYFNNAIIH